MSNKNNMELEPPRKAEVRKIAELDDNIEDYDNELDIITEIVKQKIANLQVQNKNQETEENSIAEEQERLANTVFSHDSGGSRDTEDLSDDDNIRDIQQDLKKRIFDN